MEVSNYRVEIEGGKHICDPKYDRVTPLSNSSWAPWSPWASWSSYSWSSSTSPGLSNSNDKSYVEMKDGANYVIKLTNNHGTRCHAKVSIDGNTVGTWFIPAHSQISIERPVDVAKKFTFFKVSSRGGAEAGLVKGDDKNGLITVEFTPEHKPIKCCGSVYLENDDDDSLFPFHYRDRNFFESGMKESAPQGFTSSNDNNSFLPQMNQRNHNSNRTRMFNGSNQNLSMSSAQNQSQSLKYDESLEDSLCANSLKSCKFEAGGTGLKGKSEQNFGVSSDRLDLNKGAMVTINLRLIARKDPELNYDRVTPLGGRRSNGIPSPIF